MLTSNVLQYKDMFLILNVSYITIDHEYSVNCHHTNFILVQQLLQIYQISTETVNQLT